MTEETVNSAFIEGTNMQYAWDSTSLGLLKTCPRRYYYTIVLGYKPKNEPTPLTFGSHFHKGLEIYHRAVATGMPHDEAVILTIQSILEIAGSWQSSDPNRNLSTLLRSLVWYLEEYKNDPCETIILANGKPAVELSFRFELGFTTSTGHQLLMCGHMDRLVKLNEQSWVKDYKTTKGSLGQDFFDHFTPDNQMSLYPYAAQVILDHPAVGVIIDGVQVAVNFTRFSRGFALRTMDHLHEWMESTKVFISQAELYAVNNFWPMNDKSCHHFSGCPFREVCSKIPKLRSTYLEADFKREIWDPLAVRGD